MIGVSTSPFSLFSLRKFNTWYTITDGNWSNPNIWISNGKRKNNLPQPGDNVYINHLVTLDISNLTINNLYGCGSLIFGMVTHTFNITGMLDMPGTIDMNNAGHNLVLTGCFNNVNTLINSVNSTVTYSGAMPWQPIMPITYRNLTITNGGICELIGDTIVNGNLILNGNPSTGQGGKLELSSFNFTVNGTSTLSQPSLLSKRTSIGNTLFIGNVNASGGDAKRFDFSLGNPNVEFRGGLDLNQNSQQSNLGTGTMSFTTNNQNLNSKANFLFGANIFIASGVTLTITGSGISSFGIITGADSSSILDNNSQILLFNSTIPMASTGVFNYKNAVASIIGFCWNGDTTLPYTSFNGLDIQGTGIKTLAGDTILNNNLTIENSGTLECSSSALTVGGTTTLSQPSKLSKNSSTGPLLFIGTITANGGDVPRFNFSGNPNVEFRGGINVQPINITNPFGTGAISFTTNNQTVSLATAFTVSFSSNILISGAVTVFFSGAGTIILTGIINGDNASSTLDCRGNLNYQNATAPMITGELFCNQVTNAFIYGLSGNQDIQVPADALPGYKNLTLSGSGSKRLLGNISVKGIFTLTSPTTLNSNGFALTNP